MSAEQYRKLLLDDLVAFEQIRQLAESDGESKDEIAQHARDGIAAIESALGSGTKQPLQE